MLRGELLIKKSSSKTEVDDSSMCQLSPHVHLRTIYHSSPELWSGKLTATNNTVMLTNASSYMKLFYISKREYSIPKLLPYECLVFLKLRRRPDGI
jgi:hypothetical protein